jgi:hypothetical protein
MLILDMICIFQPLGILPKNSKRQFFNKNPKG